MNQKENSAATPSHWWKWGYIVSIILVILIGQFAVVYAFRQQHAKVLLQGSRNYMAGNRNIARAQELARRAVELDKYEGYAWFNFGTSFYLQKDFDEATRILQHGITYLPHSYNALRLLAFSNYYDGEFQVAAKQFEEYLRMVPAPSVTPELVYRLAGLSWLRTGGLAESNMYLMRATDLSEQKGDLLRVRAMVSLLTNQVWSAKYCYASFRFYQPEDEFNPFETVANAIKANKLTVAIEFLEYIYREKSDDLSVIKALAAAYKSSGDSGRAEQLIKDTIARFPESPSLRLVYGDILFSDKRFPEAFEQYDEHLRLQPDSQFRQDILNKKATTR